MSHGANRGKLFMVSFMVSSMRCGSTGVTWCKLR